MTITKIKQTSNTTLFKSYRWAGNYSLVQQLLAKKGYVIVQVDSRGSNGYGRAFREEFLLGFADQDFEDYASAVAYMESLDYVDPDHIGIWGSSYGGTLSVYALLMKPGLFQVWRCCSGSC